MLSVYIHIPFCQNICTYCDFCKMYYNENFTSSYLETLEKEIKSRYQKEKIKTIYIGGGTPSCLSLKELEKLLKILTIFDLEEDYEYTIECNIESTTEDKIKLLKKYGINRLSFGVQSFDQDIQKILGRTHTEEMIFNTISMAKKYIPNINIDLIYGVTNNLEIIKKDLDKFLKLNIPHLSYYSLILEENTKLYIDKHQYISEDLDNEMFEYIDKTLTSNGYFHYEVSNYATEGNESIHNKNYWLNGEYYGFGLGAVSYLKHNRISNTKNLTQYLKGNYQKETNYEDIITRKENDLILGLRLLEGISINNFNQKYQDNLLDKEIIKELINDKYLEIDNNKLRCNPKYIYLLNSILEKIIGSEL